MITLPVTKTMQYLSASSYQTWDLCQHKLYQGKLAGHSWRPRESSKAAAIGNYVDMILKDYLKRNRPNDDFPATDMAKAKVDMTLAPSVDENACISVAVSAAKWVKKYLNEFLKGSLQMDREMYKQNPVPLMGILDLLHEGIPTDLKTRGFNSSAKPHKGWYRLINEEGNESAGVPGLIESVNEGWAIQAWFYQQLTGADEHRFIEICNTDKGYILAFHRGIISKDFDEKMKRGTQEFWEKLNDISIDIDPPVVGYHCRKYGQTCEEAVNCNPYMEHLRGERLANA